MIAQPLESMVIIDLGSYLSQSQKEEENMCKNDTTYRNDNGRNAIEGESNLTCN